MVKFLKLIRAHWRVWAYLILTLATVGIVFFWEPSASTGPEYDRHIRMWALALQVLGTATVWWDLTNTAKQNGVGPSFRKAWASIKAALGIQPSISANAIIVEGCDTMTATGRVGAWGQAQTVEDRLTNLEHFVQRHESELGNIQAAIAEQDRKQTADLKQMGKDLRRENQNLEARLNDALVGNFATLHFGVIWLFVGMILASAPVEITNLSVWLGLFNFLH